MRKILFSPSERGFFTAKQPNLPADAKAISAAKYQKIVNELHKGKVVIADSNGDPKLIDASDMKPDGSLLTADEKLELAKQNARELAQRFYNRAMLTVSGNPPDAETKSWPLQEQWARDYVANKSTSSAELLKKLWTDKHRKRDSEEEAALLKFANVIIAKADRLSQLTADLGGKLNAARDAIAIAATQAEIDAALTKQRTESEAILATAK